MFWPRTGPRSPASHPLRLLKKKGYVKLTGVKRMSQAPGFADAAPMARADQAAPDRLIWGSDYPHLSPPTR